MALQRNLSALNIRLYMFTFKRINGEKSGLIIKVFLKNVELVYFFKVYL
jgi:hypothetical protein